MSDPKAAGARTGAGDDIGMAELLRARGVRSHYQPIVHLDSGQLVAVEALARGPEGPLHLPGALFPAAHRAGLSTELEWACREAAISGVIDGGLPDGVALFVNVEPSHLGASPPGAVRRLEERARGQMRVVLELTERDLVRRPADVLRAVYDARSAGWGIALDDVGVEPASLALMPVVRPDIVKLDMSLVQRTADLEVARVASAVASYAEESGAYVLAEGVEDDSDLERALALGATLGQGWRFGHPKPMVDVPAAGTGTLELVSDSGLPPGSSPFGLVGRHLSTRITRKANLLAMSRHLERQAIEQPSPPLVLSAFEQARFFTPGTRNRYAGYAERSSLVAAFGVGLEHAPAGGVRGASLAPDDPLAAEWTVIVLTPHFAAGLIARDLGDSGVDADRRFEFAITHDRERVTLAARSLVDRVAAQA